MAQMNPARAIGQAVEFSGRLKSQKKLTRVTVSFRDEPLRAQCSGNGVNNLY